MNAHDRYYEPASMTRATESAHDQELCQALLRLYRVRIKIAGRDQAALPVLAFNAADAISILLHHMQRDEEAETGRMTIVAERICHD